MRKSVARAGRLENLITRILVYLSTRLLVYLFTRLLVYLFTRLLVYSSTWYVFLPFFQAAQPFYPFNIDNSKFLLLFITFY